MRASEGAEGAGEGGHCRLHSGTFLEQDSLGGAFVGGLQKRLLHTQLGALKYKYKYIQANLNCILPFLRTYLSGIW